MKFRKLPVKKKGATVTLAIVVAIVVVTFLAGHVQGNPKLLIFALAVASWGAVIYTSVSILMILDYVLKYLNLKVTGRIGRPYLVYSKKEFVIHLSEGIILLAITLSSPAATERFIQMTPVMTIIFGGVFISFWIIGKFLR